MKTLVRFAAVLACACPLFAQEPRLSNISTRAQTAPGANILTVGFSIGAGAPKQVLIRAIGPTIASAPFNVPGTLADPVLILNDSTGKPIFTNDNWATPVGGTGPITAATFSSVGAFALPATSRDAAMLVTLSPGNYTAQVTGATAAASTGVAIVEVYELSGTGAKIGNLSTRGQVLTGANVMLPGIVVAPGSGTRRLLIRAAGPALGAFGVPGTLADPTITLTNSSKNTVVAINDNWSTQDASAGIDATTMGKVFSQNGAFAFGAGSKDAALVADLAPGNYSVTVSGVGGTTGVVLVEAYDITPTDLPVVTITATKATADESGSNNGEYTLTRTGDPLLPLTVTYGVGGSAVNGFDFEFLPGSITFPAGASSVTLPLRPIPDLQAEGIDPVIVTVTPGSTYAVGAQNSATVTINDAANPPTLYVATIRPTGTASSSTGFGTASILVSFSGTVAGVNISFSNLSSAEVTAHLVVGNTEDYVFNLPQGQVNGALWTFAPTGNQTSESLLAALKNGNVSVRIDSATYPGGELKGTFITSSGSQAFVAPAAPPAVSLTNVTATDAARFLTQATFGPTKAEIDSLTGASIDAWINTQMSLPFTSHRAATVEDRTTYGGSGSVTNWNAIHPPNRQSAWFKTVLTAPDQLRQRVAFALSELLVVSDVALGGDNETEPLAAYYDILGNGAFGNYRTLLENVTLNPMMGNYLSSLRNSKADPVTGQTPDENYAREVMQLFTIGLNKLQPDGTLVLGSDGLPVPTYNQTTITEMAKVFTGWGYPSTSLTAFRTASQNLFSPMQNYASNHDTTVKNISPVSIVPIPAGQTGPQDLQAALDALFTHQNTAPFVSRALIQRLVTSNPSPGYVYRVAQKFANNGSGVRGDLGAVVRAILTDYEARSPAIAATQTFGKLKEPLLRLTAVMRGFNASSTSKRYLGYQNTVNGVPITPATPNPGNANLVNTSPNTFSATRTDGLQGGLAETALRSPSVFNFFHPDYVLPGPVAAAGLVAPEFEITDDNYAINVPNTLRTFVLATVPNTPAGPYTITLDLSAEQGLVATPTALVDRLNLILCANNLGATAKTRIVTALNALPAATSTLERTQTAVLLVLTSPASAVQR